MTTTEPATTNGHAAGRHGTNGHAPSTDGAGALEDGARRVDEAIAALEGLDDDARATATELKDAVEAVHRPALVAIVQALRADPRGKELLFELVDDSAVRAVLSLHGIIRPPLGARAEAALDEVRPYLQSHGGEVELVDVADRIARIRLHGACNGCSMSAVTLRDTVEEALVTAVDEIDGVEVVEDQPTAAFIPLGSVGRRPGDGGGGDDLGPGWLPGPLAAEVPEGRMVRVDVADESFVLTNVGNRLAVFRNECAHQGRELDGGMIDDGALVCPWHGFRFDATSGECLSAPGAQLAQVPLRIDGGRVFLRAG
ncbi:MAG: NifU family protein [Actinomycetota bacterium]|nr:NifU family protein [Actinomycetota bacterium]